MKNIKEKKENKELIIFLILIVLVGFLTGIIVGLAKKNNTLKDKQENTGYALNDLNKVVPFLEISKRISLNIPGIYQDKEITIKDLSDITKLAYSYNVNTYYDKLNIEDCNILEDYKIGDISLKNTCENQNIYIRNYTYYNINKDQLLLNYESLFDNNKLPKISSYVTEDIYCSYSSKEDDYKCFTDYSIMKNNNYEIETKIIKTEINDQELIVYEKFHLRELNVETYEYKYYLDINKTKETTESIENGKTYKHTFIKKDNKYYWNSTMPINE